MTRHHLLAAEERQAAAAIAAAYLDYTEHPDTGALLAHIATAARNNGRLTRLTVGPTLGERAGITRQHFYQARGRLIRDGWLTPQITPGAPGKRPRRTWTLTTPPAATTASTTATPTEAAR